MKLWLGLLDAATQTIIGRLASDGGIHVHSDATQTLDRNVPGLGLKGAQVRVPHPLEDPATHSPDSHADAAQGVHLALCGSLDDGAGNTKDHVFRVFEGAALGAAAELAQVGE